MIPVKKQTLLNSVYAVFFGRHTRAYPWSREKANLHFYRILPIAAVIHCLHILPSRKTTGSESLLKETG